MLNMGSSQVPYRPQSPQGMDTGPQNPQNMIQMLMAQQNQQGPQTTPIGQSVQPRPQQPFMPVGTLPQQQPPPMFNQNAQPGLAGMAPRNLPQGPQTDNRALGPSSPLMNAYKVPPALAR